MDDVVDLKLANIDWTLILVSYVYAVKIDLVVALGVKNVVLHPIISIVNNAVGPR